MATPLRAVQAAGVLVAAIIVALPMAAAVRDPRSPLAAPNASAPESAAHATVRERDGMSASQHDDPWPDNTPYDGSFKFARIWYDAQGFRGSREPPWHHDYPFAERNLGSILAEMSYVRAYREGGNVYRLDDPELFRHPVAILSEPGAWEPSPSELEALQAYFAKGGFFIFDDFAGQRDMRNLMFQMQRAIPGIMPVPLEVDAPIFQTFFAIETLAMMHPYRNVQANFYGFFVDNDPTKRMLAIANHNNDLGELWEFSAEGFFPVDLTNEAYKFGVNYVMYALTR
ncbi:MAG: DUF4159 domain-containing protein [Longimicrobiales bacterium]